MHNSNINNYNKQNSNTLPYVKLCPEHSPNVFVGEYMKNMIYYNTEKCSAEIPNNNSCDNSNENPHRKKHNKNESKKHLNNFVNFRNKIEFNSYNNDVLEKVTDFYLNNNNNNDNHKHSIRNVYDNMVDGPAMYNKQCENVPNYNYSSNLGQYVPNSSDNLNNYISRDNWIYNNNIKRD
jgi:hypothetical protein